MHINKSCISVIRFEGLCTKHANSMKMYENIFLRLFFHNILLEQKFCVNSFLCKYNFLIRKAGDPSSMFGQMLFLLLFSNLLFLIHILNLY